MAYEPLLANVFIMRKITSQEAIYITTYKSGEYFYTEKEDREITAISTYYKVKIKTERLVCIDCKTMTKISKLLKVTIL